MVNPDLQTSSYKFHFLYANKPMKQYSIKKNIDALCLWTL